MKKSEVIGDKPRNIRPPFRYRRASTPRFDATNNQNNNPSCTHHAKDSHTAAHFPLAALLPGPSDSYVKPSKQCHHGTSCIASSRPHDCRRKSIQAASRTPHGTPSTNRGTLHGTDQPRLSPLHFGLPSPTLGGSNPDLRQNPSSTPGQETLRESKLLE